jgi:hypothetical protein
VVGEAVEGGLDAPRGVVDDGLKLGPLGNLDHHLGVKGMHQGRAGVAGHDHVAGQQQPAFWLDLQCLVGELGIACTQDQVRVGVEAEFLLESGLDVDLGQGAEPLGPKASLTLRTASGKGRSRMRV